MSMQAWRRYAAFGAVLVILAVLTGGCRKKAAVEVSPEIAASDEALFKLGEQSIKKDEEKGLLYLRQVIDSFPKSFYAQRAKLLIADAYFKRGDEGNMILAAAEYREFIKSYPYSPSAAYCQYQVAMTFFRKAYRAGRDQSKTAQALVEFRQVLKDYPGSEQAKAAQEKIVECEERLAEHTFAIGKEYHNEGAFKASTDRLGEILTTYPSYSKMAQVYYYLGDSYFRWKKNDQAVPYLTKLVSDYPKSPFAKKAQDLLKEISRAVPAKGKN